MHILGLKGSSVERWRGTHLRESTMHTEMLANTAQVEVLEAQFERYLVLSKVTPLSME